ncbi:MAG: hypothetical protein WD055_00025 [Candidatus Dependentiae bacterium]
MSNICTLLAQAKVFLSEIDAKNRGHGNQQGNSWSTTLGKKSVHDIYVTLKFDPGFSQTPIFVTTAYGKGCTADVWVMSSSKDTFELRFNMPLKRS